MTIQTPIPDFDLSQFALGDPAELVKSRTKAILGVQLPISASDWADNHFYIPAASASVPGQWVTSPVQRAILNAMGLDAIQSVVLFKPQRFGGTKMIVAVMMYFIAHKGRNGVVYYPTNPESDNFVRTEVDPAIRACQEVWKLKIGFDSDDPTDTYKYKAFQNAVWHFRGGHNASAYEALTKDVAIIDEVDQLAQDIDGKGDPVELSYGRVRESPFRKQIIVSKPTVEGGHIDSAAKTTADKLLFFARCPECTEYYPIEWGGKDVPYGFKWTDDKPETVHHVCKGCGVGWKNDQLIPAMEAGFWRGPNGWETKDGISWMRHGEPCEPPLSIAFSPWLGLSDRLPWVDHVRDWLKSKNDIGKVKTFKNGVLAQTFSIEYDGGAGVSSEMVAGIVPIHDYSDLIAATAGVDIQGDRLEAQVLGHDRADNVTVLYYKVYEGDTDYPEIYHEMHDDLREWSLQIGPSRHLKIMKAGIDVAHKGEVVFPFLQKVRRHGFMMGVSGSGKTEDRIGPKEKKSQVHRGGRYWTLGTNTIKRDLYSMLMNHAESRKAMRIGDCAELPADYAEQFTCEQMMNSRVDGRDRIVFKNRHGARNEAFDTAYYALAMKYWLMRHGTIMQKRVFK